MSAIDIDRDAAREAAERELAKPVYPRASLRERLEEWFSDLIYRLVYENSVVPGGWFTIVVLALVVLAGLIIAVRIARRTTDDRRPAGMYGSRAMTAADHRLRAEEFAARGDWAAAIRQRVRAIGRQLEEDGALSPLPGRTAAELAREAGWLLPGHGRELDRAATIFDDISYGGRPGSERAYRFVAGLDDALRHSAPAATEVG